MPSFLDHYQNLPEHLRVALADVTAGQRVPIPLFPLGEWKSAKYPSLPLTRELADELIANFDAGVLGTEPVLDSSGKHDTSAPAAGWFKKLYVAPLKDGSEMLFGDAVLTDLGAEQLNAGLYKYDSIELGPVVDNATGETTDNVFRSATLTNTPVLRMLPPVLDAAGSIAMSEAIEVALSEITLAAIPEFIKVKMRAKWLKAHPDKTEDDVPENMQASEDPGSLAEPDPVAAAVAKLEEALTAANEALGGKLGIPVIRTYLREAIRKASAHSLADAEDPGDPAESTPASSDGSSQPAKADEGQPVTLAEGDAAPKGVDHTMKTVIQKLKLSESADEAAVLAAVEVVLSERDAEKTRADAAELRLAETAKASAIAAFTLSLDEKIKTEHTIAPGERDFYLAEADRDVAHAEAAIALRTHKVIDASERGTGTEGDEKPTKRADIELSELSRARAVKDGCDYVTAMDLVLSENPGDIKTRYEEFRAGKEG